MNRYTKIHDFHASRATGVGSSDIPVLAGLYKRYGSTPLSLWESKTGKTPPWEGNERTYWGRNLEGLILREFIKRRYGDDEAEEYLTYKRRGRSRAPYYTETEARAEGRPYCLAHSDLVIDNGDEPPYIVEAKSSGFYAGKRREGRAFEGYDPDDLSAQGIPDAVYLQVQWQLYCYGVNSAYVAVLIDTADYREYGPIAADARVQEKCLALAERFWRLVRDRIPPAPETWDDVQRLFPTMEPTTAMVAGEAEVRAKEMIERDKVLAARIKEIEEERADIKNAIGVLIGGNAVLAGASGNILARAHETARETLSLAKIAKEAPDVAAILRERELISKSEFRQVRF